MIFGNEDDDDDNENAVQPLVERPRSKPNRPPRSPSPQQQQSNSRYQEDSEAEDPHPQHYDRARLENSVNNDAAVFFDDSKVMAPKEKWIPYCPKSIDPEDLDCHEKEEIKDREWCFLCYFSESTHRHEDYAVIRQFIEYVKINWDKVSRVVLTAQAQHWYNTRIRSLWPDLPPWARKQIIYHFTIHQPDDFIMDVEELRTLNHASYLISTNELYEYEETSRDIRINPKAQSKYLGMRRRLDVIRERVSTKKSRILY